MLLLCISVKGQENNSYQRDRLGKINVYDSSWKIYGAILFEYISDNSIGYQIYINNNFYTVRKNSSYNKSEERKLENDYKKSLINFHGCYTHCAGSYYFNLDHVLSFAKNNTVNNRLNTTRTRLGQQYVYDSSWKSHGAILFEVMTDNSIYHEIYVDDTFYIVRKNSNFSDYERRKLDNGKKKSSIDFYRCYTHCAGTYYFDLGID